MKGKGKKQNKGKNKKEHSPVWSSPISLPFKYRFLTFEIMKKD